MSSEEVRFLAAAYAVTWVALLAYAGYLARRWRRARRGVGGRAS